MNIKFYYQNVVFRISNSRSILDWIKRVIRTENKCPGDLFFIFVNDEEILKINNEFLNHDYFTDVITFDNSSGDDISGEIYLGIETIERNAELYEQNIMDEVSRVIIHGVLHLLSYNDRSDEEKIIMRAKEDSYLELLKE